MVLVIILVIIMVIIIVIIIIIIRSGGGGGGYDLTAAASSSSGGVSGFQSKFMAILGSTIPKLRHNRDLRFAHQIHAYFGLYNTKTNYNIQSLKGV